VRINNRMLDMVLAKKCFSLSYLRKGGVSPQTIAKVRKGKDITPLTVGKIAAMLGVDVTEIVEQEAYPRNCIRPSTFGRIAKALNVDPVDLIET